MFKASSVQAAARSCGQKAVGACRGDNLRTRWWTPAVKKANKLKKEAFRAWLAQGSPETEDGYGRPEGLRLQQLLMQKPGCGRSTGRLWRRTFGWPQGSSGKPFRDSGTVFSKGKQGLTQAVLSRGGELLAQTEDIAGWWNEHTLLNPTNMSSEAESEDSGETPPTSLVEVAEVVKKLFSGKAPGADVICTEMMKALDIVGLSWLTRQFSATWRSETVPVEWQTRVVVPEFFL